MAKVVDRSSVTPSGEGVILPRAALAAIAVIFLLMGGLAASYGPLLEHLVKRFSVSLPEAGSVFSAHFAGALIGVFVSMWAMERVSGRIAVWAGLGCLAIGCAGVALAPSWPAFSRGPLPSAWVLAASISASTSSSPSARGRGDRPC